MPYKAGYYPLIATGAGRRFGILSPAKSRGTKSIPSAPR